MTKHAAGKLLQVAGCNAQFFSKEPLSRFRHHQMDSGDALMSLTNSTTTGGLRNETSGSRCRSEQASTQLDRIGEFIAPSLTHKMELVRKTGAALSRRDGYPTASRAALKSL